MDTASATATATSDAADATNLNTAAATSKTSSTASGTASDTASGTGTADSSATGTDTASGTASGSSSGTASGSSSSTGTADAQGSAVMKLPVTTLTSALYKIGDYVTFKWNYTDLTHTPSGINVVASASTSSFESTWTLTSNMTFATEAAYTWDTAAYQTQAVKNQQPLVVEMYTLYIYDAESEVTATAGLGSLTANAALTFGMYTGQPYTALASGWVCGTCSAALSDNEKRALGFMFTMVGITVASFTWFVTGLW